MIVYVHNSLVPRPHPLTTKGSVTLGHFLVIGVHEMGIANQLLGYKLDL